MKKADGVLLTDYFFNYLYNDRKNDLNINYEENKVLTEEKWYKHTYTIVLKNNEGDTFTLIYRCKDNKGDMFDRFGRFNNNTYTYEYILNGKKIEYFTFDKKINSTENIYNFILGVIDIIGMKEYDSKDFNNLEEAIEDKFFILKADDYKIKNPFSYTSSSEDKEYNLKTKKDLLIINYKEESVNCNEGFVFAPNFFKESLNYYNIRLDKKNNEIIKKFEIINSLYKMVKEIEVSKRKKWEEYICYNYTYRYKCNENIDKFLEDYINNAWKNVKIKKL